MAIIEMREISKAFNGETVLDKANFEVLEGDFVAITGESGCGKSTLLNAIFYANYDNGESAILGQNVRKLSEQDFAKFKSENLSILFQSNNLIDCISVCDNLLMPIYFSKKPLKQGEERLDILLKYFKIEGIKNKFPPQLSGGELQRASLVKALINEPKIMLLDEPTASLNKENAINVFKLLQQLNNDFKITIVLVTHDLDCVSYCNKVFKIVNGKCVQEK